MPTFVFDRAKGCMVDKATGQPAPLPRKFNPPRIHLALDYKAYSCPITGKMIEGRRAHQENLKRHGCRLQEPGERQEFDRRRADEDRKLEKSIEVAVEKTAAELNI